MCIPLADFVTLTVKQHSNTTLSLLHGMKEAPKIAH